MIPLMFAAIITPFLLNILLTPLILKVSHKNNWYDSLDHRKVHEGEVPRLGGVGFFISFVVCSLLAGFLAPKLFDLPAFSFSSELLFSFLGFTLVHILGLIDDFRSIRARYKLLGQIIAGVLIVLGGAVIPGFTLPFFNIDIQFGIFAGPLTVLWLISLSNAINLMDGIDGLAGGMSTITALVFAGVNLVLGNVTGAVLSAILAGSLAGFLVFNKPKAQIFMGDSGSLFLGFALGSLLFMNGSPGALDASAASDTAQILLFGGLLATLSVLLLPVGDMISAILRRIRRGTPIYAPDREHIHHKYLNFGYSVPRILGVLYTVVLLDGLTVIFWALVHSRRIDAPLWVGDLVVLAAWLGTGAFLLWNHHRNNEYKRRTEEAG